MKADKTGAFTQHYAQFARILEYMGITERPRDISGKFGKDKYRLSQELVRLAQQYQESRSIYQFRPAQLAQNK